MDAAGLFSAVILGLVLGSFATALAYRVPRGVSMFTIRRSHCPSCRSVLGAADLVPLFSWIFLRGRCRHCGAPIGWRYPLIELGTLALCLAFYAVYGLSAGAFALYALAPLLIAIIDIDLRHKIIPDSLNLAVLLAGAAALFFNAWAAEDWGGFLLAQGAAAAAGALLYGLGALLLRQVMAAALRREPMGLGDVKFCAAAGFWMGLNAEAAALFMMAAGFSGMAAALLWKRRTGEAETPFGPALAIAFIAALSLYPAGFVVR